ncbi:MAG: hypothetical protein GX561_04165 [Lentisphaerae bacterium]|jgi:LmbE family N-acetylglucosaminyl deacetylase|nr:hypothetical protein [Lentisphaerota bacterium]
MESVVFFVAHPDDDTYNVGGLLLKMRGKFDVHIVCSTRGERGVRHQTHEETRNMRMKEHQEALAITGGTIHYLDVLDGDLVADNEVIGKALKLLQEIKPRAVFTHWPSDWHPDHSATGELALKAYKRWGVPAEFYYFEAYIGTQTTRFIPDIYVDIEDVIEEKLEAVRKHVCQNVNDGMAQTMLREDAYRGRECAIRYAEGYKTRLPLTNKTRSILFEV